MHSKASDGKLCAQMLIERAKAQGVNLIALTDHDSISGIAEASRVAAAAGIGFIPGVEISAGGEREIHILGLFVHERMAQLNRLLDLMVEDRRIREKRYLARLIELGMPLTKEEIPTPADGIFTRPNLAEAMVARGYAKDTQDAFDRWIAAGKPAYIERRYLPPNQVIGMLREEGAIPVLAHPGLGGKLPNDYGDELQSWIQAGLMGIEAYHPSHSQAISDAWLSYARRHQLLVTGGSDFHKPDDKQHAEIGQMLGRWISAATDAEALLRHAPAAQA